MANQRVTIVHREQPGLHYAIPVEKYDAPGPQGSWRERGFIFADPSLRQEYGDEPTLPRRVRDRYRREEKAAQEAEQPAPEVAEKATSAASQEPAPSKPENPAPDAPTAPQRRESPPVAPKAD